MGTEEALRWLSEQMTLLRLKGFAGQAEDRGQRTEDRIQNNHGRSKRISTGNGIKNS